MKKFIDRNLWVVCPITIIATMLAILIGCFILPPYVNILTKIVAISSQWFK